MTTGISITGTITNGIVIGADASNSGDLKVFGEASGSYMEYDASVAANNGSGRLNVIHSTLRTTELRSLNNCGVCFRMYQDADTDATHASTRALLIECELMDGISNLSATSYAEISGISSSAKIEGIVNGDSLYVAGVKGEIRGAGTFTEVDNMSAVSAKWNSASAIGTGDFFLFSGLAPTNVSLDYGLRIEVTAGSINYGIGFEGVINHAFRFTAAGATTGCVENTTDFPDNAGPTSHHILIDIAGTDHYIPVWSNSTWS